MSALVACTRQSPPPPPAAAPAQYVYPTGMLATPHALSQSSGIYAVSANGSERCCWVSNDVRFVVPVPRGATSLHLDVIMPAVPLFLGKHQSITLLDTTGKVEGTRAVPVGPPTSIVFPIRDRKAAVLNVRLRIATSAVPKQAGAGPDSRRLAVIITAAYAR